MLFQLLPPLLIVKHSSPGWKLPEGEGLKKFNYREQIGLCCRNLVSREGFVHYSGRSNVNRGFCTARCPGDAQPIAIDVRGQSAKSA